MKTNFTYLILLFFGLSYFPGGVHGQSDSLELETKALGIEDIISSVDLQGQDIKMVSGNRFPIAAADLPFSTYVITSEEIRENGYETLVDALKMAPGIRVSQPGSAIEGETFLMRGLLGNAYTKILIDDVPIKPSFLAAMPIGAQLPIKEADRIEVIYGSGGALYGADASAGVINIVTKQSDKPVFMQADLSVGGGEYSAVNVMFGGRLGRGKKVVKYFAYASNVLFEKRPIFYDRTYNYNPVNYLGPAQDTSYVSLSNYAGTSATDPTLTNTPHQSRRVGGYLKYRGVTLSIEIMNRRDHSSIGLNPLAVSYRNPLTYTGERIWKANLNFFKNKPRHNRKTDITFISYKLDERSSILYVRDQVADEFSNASLASARVSTQNPDSIGILRQDIFLQNYSEYLNGNRYRYGASGDLRIEHVQNYRLFKRFTLTAGANGKASGGYPFTEFLSRPVDEDGDFVTQGIDLISFDSLTFPIQPDLRNLFEGNVFGQLFYNGKRLILAGGINQTWYTTIDEIEAKVNAVTRSSERLSGILKISDNMNIRSSWGRSFRIPNEWYGANSYRISSTVNDINFSRDLLELKPEETISWESGIRIKAGEKVSSEFTWFSNETSELINYNQLGGFLNDTIYASFLGYRNAEGSKVRFQGGQLLFNYQMQIGSKKAIEGHYAYGWTKSRLILPSGENVDIPVGEGRIHQLRVMVHPTTKSTFIFDYVRVKKLGRQSGPDGKDEYGTLDLAARYAFTERFGAFVKIINVFDMEYSGIPASRTSNDLIYNPQNGFFLRLGMNYYIE